MLSLYFFTERYVKPHPTPPAKSLAPPPKVPSRGGNVYTQARSQTFSGSSTPPTKPRPPPASRQPNGPSSVVPARPVHKSIPAPPTKSNGAPPVPPKRNSSSGRSFSVSDDHHQVRQCLARCGCCIVASQHSLHYFLVYRNSLTLQIVEVFIVWWTLLLALDTYCHCELGSRKVSAARMSSKCG